VSVLLNATEGDDGTAMEVTIQIGDGKHPFRRLRRGVVAVAILGSDTFDVAEVDVSTLAFGPRGAPPFYTSRRHWDVNRDHRGDLLSFYRARKAGFGEDDAETCVTGALRDGTPFQGCLPAETSRCGRGFGLAAALLPWAWLRRGRVRRPVRSAA
jgi:hypothetical protein